MKYLIRNTKEVQSLSNGARQFRVPVKLIRSMERYRKTGVKCITECDDKDYDICVREKNAGWSEYSTKDFIIKYSPYQIDDEIFVKETFTKWGKNILYKANDDTSSGFMDMTGLKWNPSIHMKEEQSRFKYVITNVRFERLQDMTFKEKEDFTNCNDEHKIINQKEHDEGVVWLAENLWDSSAKDGFKWEDNPYVFVYDFEILKGK